MSDDKEATSSDVSLHCRVLDGEFLEDSDDEEIFEPKYLVPRRVQRSIPPLGNQRGVRQYTGAKKIEKYNTSTGEVVAVYESQSKVRRISLAHVKHS